MPNNLLTNLLIVLFSAFFGGFISKKLKQPVIFGYLFSGLLVSAVAGSLGIDRKGLSILAEIGLVLLMFTLGLEISVKKIEKFKNVVCFGAILQIVFSAILSTVMLYFFWNFSLLVSIIMSAAFSLSSTAIVIKILTEKARLESLSGEIMTGWLLVQDLIALPMISLMPVLLAGSNSYSGMVIFAKSAGILFLTWIAAKKIVSKFTDLVASFNSRELLLIFVVSLVFIMALLTSSLGFSLGLGAFLAGFILSHATSHFAIFSEIRPLRDVFLAVFFVSLGLSIEPSFVLFNFPQIALVSIMVLLIKILVVFFILLFLKYHAKTILESAFGLSQVGEFSFILAAVALKGSLIAPKEYSLIVSVTLITMVTTPWLFSLSECIYKKLQSNIAKIPKFLVKYFVRYDQKLLLEELPFSDHIVILGYGRVGKWVGEALNRAKISFLVVEYNPLIVRKLKLEGKSVIFGDPTDINVLDFAQVDKAKLVVLAIPDNLSQKMIIANCKALNPKIKIICRSHLLDDEELKTIGADFIIHPEFEAALSITHRTLQIYGESKEEVGKMLKEIKEEHDKNLQFTIPACSSCGEAGRQAGIM